jgi:hypothetical protein
VEVAVGEGVERVAGEATGGDRRCQVRRPASRRQVRRPGSHRRGRGRQPESHRDLEATAVADRQGEPVEQQRDVGRRPAGMDVGAITQRQRGKGHRTTPPQRRSAATRANGCKPRYAGSELYHGDHPIVDMCLGTSRGCPCPLAGRSLRASMPAFTRCCLLVKEPR